MPQTGLPSLRPLFSDSLLVRLAAVVERFNWLCHGYCFKMQTGASAAGMKRRNNPSARKHPGQVLHAAATNHPLRLISVDGNVALDRLVAEFSA
jgi:hypothetical protein